jgi:hypothetical protein
MRIAVLDIGSNSAHLRIVDAYPGSPPLPLYRHKAPTRLAERVDEDGALRPDGITRVLRAVAAALKTARSQHVTEIIPIATATIRDAVAASCQATACRTGAAADAGAGPPPRRGHLQDVQATGPPGRNHRRSAAGSPESAAA